MDAANIRILIEANSTGVASGLTPGLTAINRFEQDVRSSLQRVGAAWDNLSTGTKVLAGFGVAAGLAAVAIATTIKPAIEFESAFAGVRKTVEGTPMQLAGIRAGLLEMSQVMPTTAKELADIAANAGQLGVAAPKILEFTRTIAMLGETTDLDFDSAAQSLARFLNITGNDAPIERIADVIVELGNNSATTESQIVDFGMRLASAFTVAGAAESEILALAAAFSSLGLRSEAGGSALSTIITKISDAARMGGPELKTLADTAGLLPAQFAEIAKTNPTEALLLFGEGLGKVVAAGGSVTPVLEALGIGGLRTSEVMRLLALNSDQVRTAIGLAAEQFENGGAAAEEAGKRYETTASRLEILRNRITAIQIAVGTNFLSIFARGADEAGDAIAALAELLTPLGQQFLVLFRNGAELAAAFWGSIGGPVAKAAIAALIGLSAALTTALQILNGFGPAGIAVALFLADLVKVGPATSLVVRQIDGLSASIYRIATAGSAGQIAIQGMMSAISLGSTVALTVALVSLGSALANAGTLAREAGEEFRSGWADALKANDFDAAVSQIEAVRSGMERMNEIDKVSQGWGGGWDSWTTALKSSVQVLTPFTENTVVNARAQLEELKKVAEENGFDVFESRISSTAQMMGLTEHNVLRLANQMGLLQAFTVGTTTEFAAAQNTLVAFADSTGVVAEALNRTKDELIESADNLGELSSALGISQANLQYVASTIDGLNFEDLFADDPEVRMAALNAVTGEVQFTMAALADSVGLSTDEFISQNRAVAELAGSQDALESAIRGVVDALNSINAPQERYNEALAAYEEAILKASGSTGEFIAAAQAGREAIAQLAGTAPEYDVLISKQQELASQLYDAGIAAGFGRDQVIGYISEFFNIPESVLTLLLLEAEKAKADTKEVKEDLNDLTSAAFELILDANPDLAMEVFNAMRLEKTDYVVPVTAPLDADWQEAQRKIGEAKLALGDYAAGPYTAPLTADDTDAKAKTEQREAAANKYATGTYRAPLTADDSDANAKTSAVVAGANKYAAGTYRAPLTADNSDAIAKTGQAEGAATKYARPYGSTLTANNSQAIGAIQAAINRMAGFQSKEVTLTVRNVTINQSVSAGARGNFGLEGMVIGSSGARSFAAGGYYGGGANSLASVGPSGPGFFEAIPGWARVFAEPATGGEWYIPRIGNRARQYAIWSDAGRALKFSPHVGNGGSVVISAPITVDASGSTMDPGTLADMISQRVTTAFADVARELENTRRS